MKEKYVEASSRGPSKAESNWYHHCARNKLPFIVVKKRSTYADVHFDYITYPPEVDGTLRDGRLRDLAKELFSGYACSRSTFSGDGTMIWFRDLEVTQARAAADALYDLVRTFIGGRLDKK